jgi:hypothetical protein
MKNSLASGYGGRGIRSTSKAILVNMMLTIFIWSKNAKDVAIENLA